MTSHGDTSGHTFPVGSVFHAALDAVVVMDAQGLVRDWNPSAEQVFGYTWEEVVGREVAELIIPGPLRNSHRHGLQRYLETGHSSILDHRVEMTAVTKDGSEIPVELALTRLPRADPALFAGFVRDLRSRPRIERENVRLQQRMAFLAQAGLVLETSLEFDQTLHQLAELAVPELAEIAVVDLLEEGGVIRTAVAAATDPEQARALETMRREHPLSLDGPHPVARVLRTGRPDLEPIMSPDFQRTIAEGPEHFELMRRLRYKSAIVVPLIARQRALGALSLLRVEGSEPFADEDVVLVRELARRAALAVDNARLFETTRNLARTLQDSLLPRELPEIPGARITGRYRAAAQGQEVGGDFYDVFTLDEGYWGIAIGDVCGKGPEAAALTSLVRYTLRALAGADPAHILGQLNDIVMRDPALIPDQLLTVLFAVASLDGDELVIDVASAGHPPPVRARADGSVERVDAAGPLVGLTSDPRYESQRVRLAPGDVLLLYTDGLTDARAPAQMMDEEGLADLLRRASGLRGPELVEFLEAAVTGGADPRDDIAMLVVELPREKKAASQGELAQSSRP